MPRFNPAVDASESLDNSASLTGFAGQEGGQNHLSNPLTDDARATISAASLTKTLVSTEIVNANNTNTEAVIGELITYQIVIDVPEGEMINAHVLDQLDSGLAFVSASIYRQCGFNHEPRNVCERCERCERHEYRSRCREPGSRHRLRLRHHHQLEHSERDGRTDHDYVPSGGDQRKRQRRRRYEK